MDADERELFASAVDAVCAAGAGGLDAGLEQLGWDDALDAEPQLAVSTLLESLGRHGGGLDGLRRALGAALEVGPDAVVVLPPLGSADAPGRIDGDRVVVHGLLPTLTPANRGAFVVRSDGERTPVRVVVVAEDGTTELHALAASDLSLREISGLDPRLGLVEVGGSPARATTGPTPSVPWQDAVAAGQRALAHQLVGAMGTMLELARIHALDRVQFDVPIASFQAVRHRLAESLVAIEAARAALDAAWDEGDAFTAMVAKAVAGRSARTVAKHAQQVLAGIGFTAEHDFHLHFRRVRLLDALLGDTRSLTSQIGQRLLSDRRMPPILAL
jgi:hypothetical protein